jgi:Predicted nucleotide-binding protein containing TIR-like domain
MPKKRTDDTAAPLPMLTLPLDLARGILTDRLKVGNELLNRKVTNGADMDLCKAEFQKWTDYNVRRLETMFTTDKLARDYEWDRPGGRMVFGVVSPMDQFNDARDNIVAEVHTLDSLLNSIELYAPLGKSVVGSVSDGHSSAKSRAFVVHGRDDAAKESVARFLGNLGVTPIILHEQANLGKTIIEKLEHYGNVAFAVVLVTPDDEGRLAGSGDALKPRARQNVLLELGFFVGLLGRENVCALCKPPVEVPSDWDGVVWVNMDGHDGWKVKLAKELKAAGFTVDPSALL